MRGRAALMLSFGMGVLAVLLMFVYINGRENRLLELSAMKDVIVASQDVQANTILDERVVQRVQVPAKYVQPQALTELRDAVGRVALVAIPRGAQVLGTYLEDEGRTALAYEVPRGRRALTVAVTDETGVGGLVRPGNFVDIFGTFEFGRPVSMQMGQTQYTDERTETRLMLQNVQVIAVGREHRRERPEPKPANAPTTIAEQAAREREDRQGSSIRHMTMLVGPREAQQLVLAQEIGTLTLALRSNLDAGQVVDLGTLDPLGLLQVQIPVKARRTPAWREMRGNPPF